MSAGLYSREIVARFLGKRPRDIDRMIEDDHLPAVPVPGEKEVRYKFGATQLCAWLNESAKGRRWTLDELILELSRCESESDGSEYAESLALVQELQTLCEAAARHLAQGRACPKTMRAIVDVAKEIPTEEAA